MKKQIRVMGIDDGTFSFRTKTTIVVGAIMRKFYLDAVTSTRVKVDGRDATRKIKNMVEKSGYIEQLKIIMIDGICLGGFNVVDINYLSKKLRIPVITVTRDKPSLLNMKKALIEHFDDWRERWDIITSYDIVEVKTTHKPIYMQFVGIPLKDAKEIVRMTTLRGAIPEPIRVAHLIARGISVGTSKGSKV